MPAPHMLSGHDETLRCLCPDQDTLAFAGALTFATAAQALREGSRMLQRRSRLDLAGVKHADSAGLAAVLALLAQANRRGQRLGVLRAPEGILALAEVCGARAWLEQAASGHA